MFSYDFQSEGFHVYEINAKFIQPWLICDSVNVEKCKQEVEQQPQQY